MRLEQHPHSFLWLLTATAPTRAARQTQWAHGRPGHPQLFCSAAKRFKKVMNFRFLSVYVGRLGQWEVLAEDIGTGSRRLSFLLVLNRVT